MPEHVWIQQISRWEGDEVTLRGWVFHHRTMKKLVRGETLWCDLTGEVTYDRCVAICYVGVRDVGAVMVNRGVARDCPAFSGGRYARLERAAVARGSRIRVIYPLPSYCRNE